jgi:hypothetical protein
MRGFFASLRKTILKTAIGSESAVLSGRRRFEGEGEDLTHGGGRAVDSE